MADANFEAQRMAELMAQVNEELARYGQVSRQTQSEVADAQMKGKYGIENFTKGAAKGAEVITALAGAAGAAGKAMLDGKKGAAAFNESVDGMATAVTAAATALALFVPVLGPLMLAAGAATLAFSKYTKAANEMSDKLYTGYTKMQKAGGAAADGMTGLFKDAKKLGLSMNELDGFTQIVAENSRDFVLLAGSVSEGRKQFANIGQSMEPYRASLMRLGLTQDEMNDGMAGFLKLQSRVGLSQNKTTEQLADGARKYLLEQDALTKLTGMTRKEQENAREEVRSQERFAAKLMQVRATQGEEAANELEKTYLMLHSQSKEAAQGFADIATGNLQTEAAQKSYRGSQGESMRSAQLVSSGQMKAAEAAQRVASAHGETAKRLGGTLGQIGVYNSTFGDLAGDIRLGALAQGDINKNYNKTLEDQKAGLAGADKITKDRADLIKAQQDANKAMETFIFNGIAPAQKSMKALADATNFAADKLAKYGTSTVTSAAGGAGTGAIAGGGLGAALGFALGGPPGMIMGAKIGAAAGTALGGILGGYFGGSDEGSAGKGVPKAASGGVLTGPKSGYLAMLHGTELVIPENMLKGSMSSLGSQGTGSPEIDEMSKLATEMLKDTEKLVKITDKDLIKQDRYSKTSSRLIDLKLDLMTDEIDILEEQNKMLSDMEEMLNKTMGAEKAKETMRAFKLTKMSGLGFGGSSTAGGGVVGGGGGGGGGGGVGGGGGGGAASVSAPSPAKSSGGGSNVVSGSGQPIMTGAGVPLTYGGADTKQDLQDLFDFGSASGSKSNFEQLEDGFKNAVIKAAEEYNATTGKKLRVNSAKRDSADQERLYSAYLARGKTGMPVGRPGMSRHERGLAIDIQNYGDSQAIAAMNRQGLYQKVPNDPVHFQFAKGGISNGPRSGYLATLHGPEAVVPLPDGKSIPVKMSGNQDSNSMMGSVGSDLGNMMGQLKDVLYMLSDKMNNPQMLVLMDEMVRAQKNSNDIQNKMLKAQS